MIYLIVFTQSFTIILLLKKELVIKVIKIKNFCSYLLKNILITFGKPLFMFYFKNKKPLILTNLKQLCYCQITFYQFFSFRLQT